jgi:hypothetical protein
VALLITLALTAVPLLTKTETQGQTSGGRSALEVAAGMIATYVAGPLAGFNFILETPPAFRNHSHETFALILQPLRTLGLRYTPPLQFDPFLPVPFLINIFTPYRKFHVEFGAGECSLALFLCSAISGSLFNSAVRGNKFAAFALCYVGLAVIFSPFQNSFILLYRYEYVALFGMAYFIAVPRLPRISLFRTGRCVRNRCL